MVVKGLKSLFGFLQTFLEGVQNNKNIRCKGFFCSNKYPISRSRIFKIMIPTFCILFNATPLSVNPNVSGECYFSLMAFNKLYTMENIP